MHNAGSLMDNQAVWNHFGSLWNDVSAADEYWNRKPHLAHYTSIATLEKIFLNNEIWFSNPLYMNDHEEVRFGVNQGYSIIKNSEHLAHACGSQDRGVKFQHAIDAFYYHFANDHVMDTYVFCMSEHDASECDGHLSMWRGYGANGNGVALVLDASKINKVETSALQFAKVHYGTAEVQIEWLNKKVLQFSELLAAINLTDDQLIIAASALFERIKSFALFSKHKGFEEEREWRIVYNPVRDAEKKYANFFSYAVGPHGVEPKFKFKLQPVDDITASDFSLEKIVSRILLGPTTSSPLAIAAFNRLLDTTSRQTLKERVRASSIPFRVRW